MTDKRMIEVFSAGCSACEDAIALIRNIACESCEVVVLDMADEGTARRAKNLGVKSVPAVAIDGSLADCCSERGLDEAALRSAGLGQHIA